MSNCGVSIPLDDIVDAIIKNDDYMNKIVDEIIKRLDVDRLVKTYQASVHLTLGTAECGIAQRVAVAYHPEDVRDPEATTALTDSDGDIIAYLYPDSSELHNVPVKTKAGAVIGYGMGTGSITYVKLERKDN